MESIPTLCLGLVYGCAWVLCPYFPISVPVLTHGLRLWYWSVWVPGAVWSCCVRCSSLGHWSWVCGPQLGFLLEHVFGLWVSTRILVFCLVPCLCPGCVSRLFARVRVHAWVMHLGFWVYYSVLFLGILSGCWSRLSAFFWIQVIGLDLVLVYWSGSWV